MEKAESIWYTQTRHTQTHTMASAQVYFDQINNFPPVSNITGLMISRCISRGPVGSRPRAPTDGLCAADVNFISYSLKKTKIDRLFGEGQ